jgi:hypothetical protein
MARFCANCGTEVDETAVFCPTCGQPIDQEVETQMPAAPAWPDPEPAARRPSEAEPPAEPDRWAAEPATPAEPARSLAPGLRPDPESVVTPPHAVDSMPHAVEPAPRAAEPPATSTATPEPARPAYVEPTRVEERPAPRFDTGTPPPPAPPPGSPPTATGRPGAPSVGLPVTMPVTLSAWLIGGGAALAAAGALFSLFDAFGAAIDLVALVLLALVAVSVFFSATIPTIPNLRLFTLAIVLVVFGIAVDRLGFGGAGAGELLLFLGSAAAVIGAFLLELGRDQPLGGPQP